MRHCHVRRSLSAILPCAGVLLSGTVAAEPQAADQTTPANRTPPAKAAAAPVPAAKATSDVPAAAPLPVGDEVRAWYLRNEIGGNFLPSISLADRSYDLGPGVLSWTGASLSMDAGVAWNTALGWRVTDQFAIEVASGIFYNTFGSLSGAISYDGTTLAGSVDVGGSLLQVPVMAGARLELPVARDLWLNLGASAGGIYLHGDLDTTISDGVGEVRINGSDGAWAFAYSATIGLEWDLSADWGVGIAYRFVGTTSANFGPFDFIGAAGVYNQNVAATVTLRF